MALTSVAAEAARFDWYAATIRDSPESVLEVLAGELGGRVRNGVAMHGYERGYDIVRDGSTVARVLAGGRNGNPHAWASSDDTDRFVDVVRAHWGASHRPSRMDAAIDYDGPGCWDALYPLVLDLATDPDAPWLVAGATGLKIDQAGDWINCGPDGDGRTFYVGGRKSATFLRLYEKGKQQRRAEGGSGDPARWSPDWVRAEVQVRPDGAARDRAATATPVEAFGYSMWTKELLHRLTGADVDRVHVRERRVSDDDRALEWMVYQYGEHLDRLVARLGGYWQDLGQHLGLMRAEQLERRGIIGG